MANKVPWLRPSRNEIELSIITDPIPIGKQKILELLKFWGRKGHRLVRNLYNPTPQYLVSIYRGHPAVTRSIIEGLQKLNIPYSYNPKKLSELSQTVVVVSGISALKQMIYLKQQGYIRRLIVGPNIMNDPGKEGGILAAPEVDLYITHAPVCALIGRFLPTLAERCVPWAAGVDCDYWKPDSSKIKNHILIYVKENKGPVDFNISYVLELERRGYEVTVINYGAYSAEQYKSLLQASKLMIGFSRDESQGIAWTEAWGCDVPTFFWNNTEPIYLGVKYDGSAAPYLNDATGKFFTDIESFIKLLDQWENNEFEFSPRSWCLENQSDEVVAKDLLRILKRI